MRERTSGNVVQLFWKRDWLSPDGVRRLSRRVILYVITDLKVGGVPLHLQRLAGAMRDRGWEPKVVSLGDIGPVGERLRSDGIEVLACNGCCGWDLRVIYRLAKITKQTGPHVVHAMLFHANVAARIAADWVGYPAQRVLCEIQTVEVERRWHLTVDRWTHRGCRYTIGNSPSVIDHLARTAGIPRDRLKLVRGGIDPIPLAQAAPIEKSEIGVPNDAPMVLWVGRLDPVKGLDVLVQAFERGLGTERAHLVLAGDGPSRDKLAERIEKSGRRNQIHMLGSRDDIPRLLKAADVFVLPSRTEGLPNALLEAMAAGCPIVTTDVPGCRDLIEHESSGLIVPPDDPGALIVAIARLLQDREEALRLGHQATESVSANWHSDRTLAAYDALYAESSAC